VHIQDLYSVIVTDQRAECLDFYVRWGDHAFGLAFMAPDHPSHRP